MGKYDRARRVKQIERLTMFGSPPDPKNISRAAAELRALANSPQDALQRQARERLLDRIVLTIQAPTT